MGQDVSFFSSDNEDEVDTAVATDTIGMSEADFQNLLKQYNKPSNKAQLFANRFKKLAKIGQGTFGTIFKVQDTQSCYQEDKNRNQYYYAVKKLKHKGSVDGLHYSCMREIRILPELNSEYIVKHYETFLHKDNVCILMELMDVDLNALIKYYSEQKSVIPATTIKHIMYSVGKGLSYLHMKMEIMHRDIKPGNILLNRLGHVKLCDFGLVRRKPIKDCSNRKMSKRVVNAEESCLGALTPQAITRWYRPPELLYGSKNYGYSVDMWSMGCVLGELLEGGMVFFEGQMSDISQLHCIFSVLGTPVAAADWPEMLALPDYLEFKKIDRLDFIDMFPFLVKMLPNMDDRKAYQPLIDLALWCLKFNPDWRPTSIEAVDKIRLVLNSNTDFDSDLDLDTHHVIGILQKDLASIVNSLLLTAESKIVETKHVKKIRLI